MHKKATMTAGVLYVPKLAGNLFSVSAGTHKGQTVQFGQSCCWIKNSRSKVIVKDDSYDACSYYYTTNHVFETDMPAGYS